MSTEQRLTQSIKSYIIPDNGSTSQVLTKSASGYGWNAGIDGNASTATKLASAKSIILTADGGGGYWKCPF